MAVEPYSKHLCSSFRGVLQVVATESARALSFNGFRWEPQYSCQLVDRNWKGEVVKKRRYIRFGRWKQVEDPTRFPMDPRINAEEVETISALLQAELETLTTPFPMDDVYEYWLLDDSDKRPLALLTICRHAEETVQATGRPHLEPISAAELDLKNTEEEQKRGLPPVTYRLESLVNKRVGQNPVAVWYRRDVNGNAVRLDSEESETLASDQFPKLLLRADWQDSNTQDFLDHYLTRLVPRLLVLQHLTEATRKRLKYMTAAHALEVDEHVQRYPQIIDSEKITTLRVEASLQRCAK